MVLNDQLIRNIKSLCSKNRVKSLVLFGSAASGDFNQDSDYDFAVDFEENDPIKYSDLYFNLKESLENLLKRKVDLIEERGIRNPYFRKQLEDTKVSIYG